MERRLGPVLLIPCLALLFFAELLLHPAQTLYSDYSDLLTLHLPSRQFLVRSWQESGEIPRWCPFNFAGMPFVHDPQVSAFYPPHLLLYLVRTELLGAGMSWLIVLHVIAAGWCMYAYARHQGLGVAGALVAATGYMFAGKWLLHILAGGHYNMIPLAWLPLVLLWLEKAVRQKSIGYASAAGASYALIVLGAYPYVTLYAGIFTALWTLGIALEESGILGPARERPRRHRFIALASWAMLGYWTALVAVALSAVQLLPAIEASREASRSAGVSVSTQMLLDSVRSLVGLVGPPLSNEPNCWENRAGLGLIWLALACMAPLVGGGRVRFQAVICLLLALFSFGGGIAFQWLPGFRLFRLPSRIMLIAALPVALLAGRTVQALVDQGLGANRLRQGGRRIVIKLSATVLFLAGFYAVTLYTQRPDLRVTFHPYWLTLLVTIPGALLLLSDRGLAKFARGTRASAWRPLRRGFVASAWLAILLVDLCTLTWQWVQVRPDREIYAPSQCVRYLSERSSEHGRTLDINPLSYETSANNTPLWPGLPTIERIEPVRGFNPIDILRYKEYVQFITDDDQPLRPLDQMFTGPILGTFPIKNQELADLLGIRFLLQPADLPLEATVQTAKPESAWTCVSEDPDPVCFNFIPAGGSGRDCGVQPLPPYKVYENRKAAPRAFIVPHAAPLPERPRILTALKHADFRHTVLLEGLQQKPRECMQPTDRVRQSTFQAAPIKDYQPNHITIDVNGTAGYLVLTDIWFPGWTCEIDGQPAPVYRANYLFRAVELPHGARQAVFTFTAPSYEWGKWISEGAVALLLALTLVTRLARVRPKDSTQVPSEDRYALVT
jgi:hypothetical protein